MNAKISYGVVWMLHPWDDDRRAAGVKAWCLVKVTKPEAGPILEEAVAIFAWDREAEIFQGHVFSSEQDGVLVEISPDVRELFQNQKKIAERNAARARLEKL